MNSERGREIHGKAEQARERGEFVESLKLTDEATVIYTEEKDYQGLSEVVSTRLLAFRHLYEKTGDDHFLILAKHSALAGVEIAEKSDVKEALSMPYFNLAKAYDTLEEFPLAVENYKKAVDTKIKYPGEFHNRPGVIADMKGHLAMAEYNNGDHEALSRALEALAELEGSDEPKGNKDVWMSGAHMRIAEGIAHANPDAAREHLQKAREIINSNPDLVLRKGQIEKLLQKLNISL